MRETPSGAYQPEINQAGVSGSLTYQGPFHGPGRELWNFAFGILYSFNLKEGTQQFINSRTTTPCIALHPHLHRCSESSFSMMGKEEAVQFLVMPHHGSPGLLSYNSNDSRWNLMVNKCRKPTLASSKMVRSFHTYYSTRLCLPNQPRLCMEPGTTSSFVFTQGFLSEPLLFLLPAGLI